MKHGRLSRYKGAIVLEIENRTMEVLAPDPKDCLIHQCGDREWLTWMHDNFVVQDNVPELGYAPSYAVRLYNYAYQGRDQVEWVIQRLRAYPDSRSATITTLMPLTDTSYIPCISLLDFWVPDESLELVVYAHSLDFGRKAYGNLIELAQLQAHVSEQIARSVGRLVIHVKSAHVYEPEWEFVRQLCDTTMA
jgi:thymidylate synthase